MSGSTATGVLRKHFESIRLGELRRLERKLRCLTDDERRSVEAITAEVIHALASRPEDALEGDAEPAMIEALVRLFALDPDVTPAS